MRESGFLINVPPLVEFVNANYTSIPPIFHFLCHPNPILPCAIIADLYAHADWPIVAQCASLMMRDRSIDETVVVESVVVESGLR